MLGGRVALLGLFGEGGWSGSPRGVVLAITDQREGGTKVHPRGGLTNVVVWPPWAIIGTPLCDMVAVVESS
eukprot:6003756-Pyramimonas_sp.AAC.1